MAPSAFLPDVARPALTVDMVVWTLRDGALHLLLVQRGRPPFEGAWALPGGFVHVGAGGVGGESVDAAAARELVEETGLTSQQVLLQPLQAYGDPQRDPRGRVISIAYMALVRPELLPFVHAGSDAADARFFDVDALPALAFDHATIVADARARLRHDVARGRLRAFHLAPAHFTIAELRAVHEAVGGHAIEPALFRKRFARWIDDGVVVQAPGRRVTGRRPAAVWKAAHGT